MSLDTAEVTSRIGATILSIASIIFICFAARQVPFMLLEFLCLVPLDFTIVPTILWKALSPSTDKR